MPESSPNRYSQIVLPSIVLLFAFIVRLAYISLGPYHLDCLNLAIKATETLQTHHLQYLFGSGYPLVVILGTSFIYVLSLLGGNDPVFAVNLMSCVFGALGIWMFFLVFRKIESEKAAIAGSLLFCVSPILWGTSVYGMSHSSSLFFLLLSLYFMLSFLEKSNRTWLIFSALAFGLMGATRLQDMILMAIPMSYLLLSAKEGQIDLKSLKERGATWFLFFFITTMIVILFHLPYFIDGLQGEYNQQWKSYFYLGLSSNFRGLWSEYLFLSMTFLKTNYTLIGLLMAVPGWVVILIHKRKMAVFIALWFLIHLFFLGNLSTVVPRFFVVMIPALIICQVSFLAYLTSIHVLLRWLSIAVLVIIMGMQTNVILPGIMYRHESSAIKDYSIWVGGNTEENAKIITGDEFAFINYYSHRFVDIRPSCAVTCPKQELEEFRSKVDSWMLADSPVYITNTALLADNPNGEFKKFMDQNYILNYVGKHLSEDWHQDGFKFRVGYEKLFRLESKRNR